MSVHIAMLLSNPFRPDPRVHKEARSLVEAGYKVTVICWDRLGEITANDVIDGISIRRVSVRSAYKAGARQMFYLPRFWQQALKALQALRPDVIHCHDLETTPAGYWYARKHRLPWIFDAHECYPEQTRLHTNAVIYYLLLWLERWMAKRATFILTVGNLLAERFRRMGGRVEIVGNYQVLKEANSPQITRARLGIRTEEFVVAYIGSFMPSREILPLMAASEHLAKVTVLLLGDGPQRAAIEAELPKYPRVRYLGHVPQERVPDYTALADVIYYGLKADDRNNQYSCPNALFNALAAGKPLLTTNVGEIAHIVREEHCGLVIEKPAPALLAEAITQLRARDWLERLTKNARRAANNKYNWNAAATTLLAVYQKIISETQS
jgi:glycosyltransferase involved in cell wall biosynthesis